MKEKSQKREEATQEFQIRFREERRGEERRRKKRKEGMQRDAGEKSGGGLEKS